MELSADAPLATWDDPACSLTVVYPLALFYEIEFMASEGYRRISHGGIEHGGVLYGRVQNKTIRIEAFRAIECEHAFGPSFVLSGSDIEKLRIQLHETSTDAELAGLTVLGWFISHSRRGLEVTDAEWEWFDSLFPEPWQTLLLIKPEKFKATRFAFAFREDGRSRQSDLTTGAFFLPLPGRSDRKSRDRNRRQEEPVTLGDRQALEKARGIPEPAPVKQSSVAASLSEPEPVKREAIEPNTPVTLAARRPRLLLWLCCLTCCVLVLICALRFYWNYAARPLMLHAAARGARLVISWPAETGASSGDLKIQSGGAIQTMRLNADQMRMGQVTTAVTGSDVKVDLTAHHWFHDERGLLRVLLPEQSSK